MNIQNRITQTIMEFPARYSIANNTRTKWLEPVIGFADAEDPLFEALKTIVSPTHALPDEIVPGAKSVVAYFMPFERYVNESNIPEEESSIEWDYAYIETNQMLDALSKYLHEWIRREGYDSSEIPATYNYDPIALKSDWSHRSAAYIAGVGTFGVNNMLITEKGCCGRVGSVITSIPMEATARPAEEYCLYKSRGTCLACIKRCPIGALKVDPGHAAKVSGSQLALGGAAEYGVFYDRHLCNFQIFDKVVRHFEDGDADTCGKCLVGLPCSMSNPCRTSC